MGGKSPIMSIFSYSSNQTKFSRYPIHFYQKPLLAIEDSHDHKPHQIKKKITNAEINVFPHAGEYKNVNKINKKQEAYPNGN